MKNLLKLTFAALMFASFSLTATAQTAEATPAKKSCSKVCSKTCAGKAGTASASADTKKKGKKAQAQAATTTRTSTVAVRREKATTER